MKPKTMKRWVARTTLFLCVLLTLAFQKTTGVEKETRHALVIGNAAYKVGRLFNPANDAKDMASVLKELGFEVNLLVDANRKEIRQAIRDLGSELKKGGVGLFYFAGHGMQVKGVNYLIPIETDIDAEHEIQDEAIDAGSVLRAMQEAENPLNIVILDACRNNPFARSFRSTHQGLAEMDAPKGALIVYATAPGSVADDGPFRNGMFTAHLLKHIKDPGIEVGRMLRKVRVDVLRETNEKQIPWDSSSLTGEFYFAGSGKARPDVSASKEKDTTSASYLASAARGEELPSIAVLPFTNLSDDPEQEYFSDGITEDIITDLSKIKDILVIARNSTFLYKGRTVDVKRVGEKLGVRYVMEGSVQRYQDRVRINAKLIDASTSFHLWAERYDGRMNDIFDLQDQITQKIVTALTIKLTSREKENITRPDTTNMEAYDTFLKGWAYYQLETREGYTRAYHLFKKAVELDPDYSKAHGALATVQYYGGHRFGHGFAIEIGKKSLTHARLSAEKSLPKKPNSVALGLSSFNNMALFLFDEAVKDAEKAIEVEPNSALANLAMARALITADRSTEGLGYLEKYKKMNPGHLAEYFFYSGLAHFSLGNLKKSEELVNRAIRYAPDNFFYYGLAQAVSALLGHDGEVEARWTRMRKSEAATYFGSLSTAQIMFMRFKNPVLRKQFAQGLLKAGVPGRMSDLKNVDKEKRLTGRQIKEKITGKTILLTVTSFTIGYDFSKDHKISRFGQFKKGGFTNNQNQQIGQYSIKDNQLCFRTTEPDLILLSYGYDVCGYLYQNPEGFPGTLNEYYFISSSMPYDLSIASAEVEKKVKKAIEIAKKERPFAATGVARDGRFVRTASPSFTIEYPKSFTMIPLTQPYHVFYGFYRTTSGTILALIISIFDIKKGQNPEEAFEDRLGIVIKTLQRYFKKAKVLSARSIHIYDGFTAWEIEFEWAQGEAMVQGLSHWIVKENKIISLHGQLIVPTEKTDLKQFLEIFKTIDLDPEKK